MKKIVMIILLSMGTVLCCAAPAAEKDIKVYSLDDLVSRMLKVNLSLRIQEKERQVDNEQLRVEKRWPNPHLSASLGRGLPYSSDANARQIWGLGLGLTIPNPLSRAYALMGRSWFYFMHNRLTAAGSPA